MMYCRKSFYKELDNFRIEKIVFCGLQILAIILMLFYYNGGYVILNASSFFFFVLHKLSIEKKISRYEASITEHQKKRMMVYKYIMYIYTVFTIVLIANIIIFAERISILWWLGAVSIMVYCDSVILSAVVAFGKDGFISGDYYVKYEDIERICEEKNVYSIRGRIIWISLLKNNKKIGFDKMFTDEYYKLQSKIFRNA